MNGDGFVDLVMKFKTDDVLEVLELDDLLPGALVELVVAGEVYDGSSFAASDCVRLVPPGSGPAQLTVTSNVPDASIEVMPLDSTLDGGGYTDFVRNYDNGTVVILTATQTAPERPFMGWKVDGVMQASGRRTIQLTAENLRTLRAVYGKAATRPPSKPQQQGAVPLP